MSFTIESEKQNGMSFLDVQIIRENKTFTASVVNLPLVEFTHFDSFLLSTDKFGTVCTLAYRYLPICSNWTILYNELFV